MFILLGICIGKDWMFYYLNTSKVEESFDLININMESQWVTFRQQINFGF